MRRTALLALALLAAIAIGVAAWLAPHDADTSTAGPGAHAAGPAVKAGEAGAQRTFSLVDHHGRPITDDTFRGEWLIVFFGFTHCPDFCPTTLFQLNKTLEELEARAENVRVLFITVDPERDTPEMLAAYLRPLGPKFIGATGSTQQIEAATRAFRTYSRKQPASTDGSYSVDHSTQLYVVDPDGLLSRQLSSQATPDQLATTLRSIVDRRS